MGEINLLNNDETTRVTALSSETKSTAVYVLVGLLVLEAAYFGFLFWRSKALAQELLETEREIARLQFELGNTETSRKEAISFQERVSNLDFLLKNHIFWTKVFGELENFTFIPVQFSNLQVDDQTNTFTLGGNAPTYTDLSKLMVGLSQSKNVKNVSLKTSFLSEGEQGGIQFLITAQFDPKILLK